MSEKWSPLSTATPRTRRLGPTLVVTLCALAATLTAILCNVYFSNGYTTSSLRAQRVPLNAQQILSRCAGLRALPGPPTNFLAREESDRFEPGTNATLIRNATIWTGANNGTVVISGDILLDRGIIKEIGDISDVRLASIRGRLEIVNANGAWVTPGLVDLHSHLGVMSLPFQSGSFDLNSPNGPVVPYLRSIDAFHTHDEALHLAIAGGVTSAQILPGSSNAIAGQAFMVKLRKTSERSSSSMLLEPPPGLNGTTSDSAHPRWRYLKQAAGENIVNYGTRMDTMWSYRSAYHEARKVKGLQDAFCQKAEAGLWESIGNDNFPEDLQYEMLVDVLRGKVKVSNHVYEVVDIDSLVRLSNEFQFSIASIHHAAEAWLVPNLLKRMWGGPPTIALFATNYRYKREAYRGSEFAPRVLADNNITVVMKSDHPAMNGRYLMYEAQQAHYFGLPPHLSLASVTSTPARAAGLDHRIGILAQGADADVVVWDSHPLQIGATPSKVWIDGIAQIPVPLKTGEKNNKVTVGKGKEDSDWKRVPGVPNWDEERRKAVEWEGLPPLEGKLITDRVVFTNVAEIWTKGPDGVVETMFASQDATGVVLVENGKITCAGASVSCTPPGAKSDYTYMDLEGGSISPGIMSFGSLLGVEEIQSEPSTGDGALHNPFLRNIPKIFGDVGGVVRAVDALQFGTRNALTAYRSGVTVATVSLQKDAMFGGDSSIISGLSTTFRTGVAHGMERGAIVQTVAALHVTMTRSHPLGDYNGKSGVSVSEEIGMLKRLLFGFEPRETPTGFWFGKAMEGQINIVIEVHNADIMASLLKLKSEVEERWGSRINMAFSGATEAHLLAKEIGWAGVGVILSPSRPCPSTWDQRRILAGPPLTNDTSLVKLIDAGVTVAIGVTDAWAARNGRLDLAWASIESNGRIDKQQAYALATTNLEKLLGVVNLPDGAADLVAYQGGSLFDLSSKVVGVLSAERGGVDLF